MTVAKKEVHESIAITAHCTQTQLADLFGVSRTTLHRWAEAGMPGSERGKYDARACIRWAVARHQSEGDALRAAQIRLAEERAASVQQRREIEAGRLVRADEAASELADIAREMMTGLLSLPAKLAAAVAGRPANEAQAVLDNEIRQALGRLSRRVSEGGRENDSNDTQSEQ